MIDWLKKFLAKKEKPRYSFKERKHSVPIKVLKMNLRKAAAEARARMRWI